MEEDILQEAGGNIAAVCLSVVSMHALTQLRACLCARIYLKRNAKGPTGTSNTYIQCYD